MKSTLNIVAKLLKIMDFTSGLNEIEIAKLNSITFNLSYLYKKLCCCYDLLRQIVIIINCLNFLLTKDNSN